MCKKQTSVSHSSTESEIISLDTGLRLDGLPALQLWDLIVSVLGNISHISDRTGKPVNDVHKHHKPHKKIDAMKDIDFVPSNVQSARQEALLYVFEDNEAVIKMIIKGRSPTMRHVSRTHRVALDWLFGRINLDSKIQIEYIDTKNQLADILTKGNFTRDEWIIFCVCSTSAISAPSTASKRCRQEHKKIQVKKESQQNRSRWWISSHDTAWGIRTCFPRLHLKARRKPNLKVRKYLWARWLSSKQEQGDPYWALAYQTTQSGTLTTSGLLKSGNLVKCWEEERGDPWVDNSSHSTQTSLSSMTMMWTLTPPQNRTFL